MRKKSKKCRKTSLRGMGGPPSANKENSYSDKFHNKAAVHGFRNKTSEPANHSCIISGKTFKNKKKSEVESNRYQQQHSCKKKPSVDLDFCENKEYLSIAYFIPLNTCFFKYQDSDPPESTVDWNSLVFYESNKAAMIPNRSNEKTMKMFYYKKTNLPQLRVKFRSTSESSTDSEDSFVCFESSDDSFEDVCECEVIQFARPVDQSSSGYSSDCPTERCSKQKSSGPKKKVRFADNSILTTTHVMVTWDYAYRAARISPWETMARDSNRFKLKIHSLEPILNPVLNLEHRTKIWETRMRKEET